MATLIPAMLQPIPSLYTTQAMRLATTIYNRPAPRLTEEQTWALHPTTSMEACGQWDPTGILALMNGVPLPLSGLGSSTTLLVHGVHAGRESFALLSSLSRIFT